MKNLFLIFTASLFLFVSSLSIAGIDYIQYQEEFEKQDVKTAPLQHKSSLERSENNQTTQKNNKTTCKKTFYHKNHKKADHKNSNKKCNL